MARDGDASCAQLTPEDQDGMDSGLVNSMLHGDASEVATTSASFSLLSMLRGAYLRGATLRAVPGLPPTSTCAAIWLEHARATSAWPTT
mmetsp:Transcript_78676/g.190125  ORF Transcript_78676/g.190125 Transcript_78676/m.190125 type:complete len:89 (-) Transcript_78676:1233-1499(-)|eukprot:scaffold51789_cov54-Phaeocystis_antarctica.AAC.2